MYSLQTHQNDSLHPQGQGRTRDNSQSLRLLQLQKPFLQETMTLTPNQVEKCQKCNKWIAFNDKIVSVEFGKMGQSWDSGSGFICYVKTHYFYHMDCWPINA